MFCFLTCYSFIIVMFLLGSPRISPNFDIKTVKRSTENHSVVFTFKTLAYPEPPVDDFQWFGWYGGQWVSLRNNEAFKIDTRNLESNLTVNYVNKTSYGLYKVIVRNPLGQFEQIFLLLPTGNLISASKFATVHICVCRCFKFQNSQ